MDRQGKLARKVIDAIDAKRSAQSYIDEAKSLVESQIEKPASI